jgi:hypothetical protein
MNIESWLNPSSFLKITAKGTYEKTIQNLEEKSEAILKSTRSSRASDLENLLSIHQKLFVSLEKYQGLDLNLPKGEFNKIKNAIINQTSDRSYNFSSKEKTKLITLVRERVYEFLKTEYRNYLNERRLNEDDKQSFINRMNKTFINNADAAISYSPYGISVYANIIDDFISNNTIENLLNQFKRHESQHSRREPLPAEKRGHEENRGQENEKIVKFSERSTEERTKKRQRTEPLAYKNLKKAVWSKWKESLQKMNRDNAKGFNNAVIEVLFKLSGDLPEISGINDEIFKVYVEAAKEEIEALANRYLEEKDIEREEEGGLY